VTFLDAKENFFHHFNFLRYFTHCDGLVFASTNTGLYLFNPATRDAIALPDSHRNDLRRARGRSKCYCAGLGLDPRIGKYKVVQAFYRSGGHWIPTREWGRTWGWRCILLVAAAVGGRLPMILRTLLVEYRPPCPSAGSCSGASTSPWSKSCGGILELSLDDEEFNVVGLPDR